MPTDNHATTYVCISSMFSVCKPNPSKVRERGRLIAQGGKAYRLQKKFLCIPGSWINRYPELEIHLLSLSRGIEQTMAGWHVLT